MLRNFIRYGLAIFLALSGVWFSQLARADDNKEYLVKSAFIYNFVKFVEWPDGKAISKQSNIDICTVGDSPLNQTTAVFKQASTAKLALTLVQEKNPKNIASHCHVVFISSAEEGQLPEILAAIKGQPVLTVSDMDGFAEHGGMIGFVTNDNKIKIEVNKKSLDSASLRVDAQLLGIALKVIDK